MFTTMDDLNWRAFLNTPLLGNRLGYTDSQAGTLSSNM